MSGKDAFCLLLKIYMNWIDKRSQTNECATFGNCRINRLLFVDDLVLLSSTEFVSNMHHNFAAACDIAGMKICNTKTEVLNLAAAWLS